MRFTPAWLLLPNTLLRTYGWRGMVRRAVHEIRSATGQFKRVPNISTVTSVQRAVPIYGPAGDLGSLAAEVRERIVSRGLKVFHGEYEAYGFDWRRLPADPREWHRHPFTAHSFPMIEWWRVQLLPESSDVKDVWEPGRFSWVYDLVRAYVLTGERKFARKFHETLAQWKEANPPFLGPQWACGQETAIRVLAILHAEACLPVDDADPDSAVRIATVLAWSGERIADAIGYGLSQRNNHGISEAAGLVHLGVRLRNDHLDAGHWLELGRRRLDEQIMDQFDLDGWYAQHSLNYLRVALEQALLAQRALQIRNLSLSSESLLRLGGAMELLANLIDADSGLVPNHGANDGARIAPLSMTEYRDFRPVLTLAAIVLDKPLPADIPADKQMSLWLGRTPGRKAGRGEGIVAGAASGWVVARVGKASAFLRAGAYRHRPSHLDLLHLDVRFGSTEAICDAGTFSYNAPWPWNNGLALGPVHNAPLLDVSVPAQRGPRFLWYSWPRARICEARMQDGQALIVAEIPGQVRRTVRVMRGRVEVQDEAIDPRASTMRVTWLLHPELKVPAIIQSNVMHVIEAQEGRIEGWFSPTYGLRQPSRAVRIDARKTHGRLECTSVIHSPCG